MKKIPLIKITIFMFLAYSIYKFIFPRTTEDLGAGYIYSSHPDDTGQYIVKNKNYIVPEEVAYYDFDDDFIIATRIIVNIYRCCHNDLSKCEGSNFIMFNFINLKKLEYWIIDKKENIAYVSLDKHLIELKLQDFDSDLKFNNDTYSDDNAMIMQSSENPSDKICVLENDPSKNNILKKIIDLDKK